MSLKTRVTRSRNFQLEGLNIKRSKFIDSQITYTQRAILTWLFWKSCVN